MRFDPERLTRALGVSIDAAFAVRWREAVRTMRGADAAAPIPADDLGALLAEAIVPGAGGRIAAVDLASVEINVAGHTVALDPSDAHRHPLLTAWLPLTLGEALAAPLVAASTLAALALGQPSARLVEIVEHGDAALGLAVFGVATALGEARVICRYGEGERGPLVTTHRLEAAALAMAGWSLVATASPTAPVHSPPPIVEGASRPEGVILN